MARAWCLIALLAGLVAAPGCSSCFGGGCRRPSFMEFGSCLGGGCRSPAPVVYSAPMAPACGTSSCGGCDECGQAAAPCCDEGMIGH